MAFGEMGSSVPLAAWKLISEARGRIAKLSAFIALRPLQNTRLPFFVSWSLSLFPLFWAC